MAAELDVEEKQIRAGTHPGLLAELKAIEDRRNARIAVANAQKQYAERMWEKNYQAVRKAAFDQYKVCMSCSLLPRFSLDSNLG